MRFKSRQGISNVLTTFMLTAVLLVILTTATFVSNDILNAQMVESEFENAKNLIRTIDNEIEELLFKPGSSSVIQASFTNILPGYSQSDQDLTILVEDQTQTYINESIKLNKFTFTGRKIFGGEYNYNLKGGQYLLAPINNGSLGRIYFSKPDKLQVSLEYNRVLYSLTGKVFFINNQTGNYTLHNTMELVCVELEFGEFSSADNSIIVIENKKGELPISKDLEGDFNISVTTPSENSTISLSEIGGDPSLPTVLTLYQIKIKISVLGG